jgi:hypothetical protein
MISLFNLIVISFQKEKNTETHPWPQTNSAACIRLWAHCGDGRLIRNRSPDSLGSGVLRARSKRNKIGRSCEGWPNDGKQLNRYRGFCDRANTDAIVDLVIELMRFANAICVGWPRLYWFFDHSRWLMIRIQFHTQGPCTCTMWSTYYLAREVARSEHLTPNTAANMYSCRCRHVFGSVGNEFSLFFITRV